MLPRAALGGAQALVLACSPPDTPLPLLRRAVSTPDVVAQIKARNQQVLDDAEASFQNSELLRTLKERSDANRAGGWAALGACARAGHAQLRRQACAAFADGECRFLCRLKRQQVHVDFPAHGGTEHRCE